LGLIPVREFSDIVALSQMTPGPIAVNAATYIGYKSAFLLGATVATLGVTLPSFIIILMIDSFFTKFKENKIVKEIISGIRPATVGMIASAVIFFAETSIFKGELSGIDWREPLKAVNLSALLIFILTIIGAKKFKIGPITLTILAGVIGGLLL
jgi:chromate transporter